MATAETCERILDAAEHLFARRGYRGVSLRAITDRASVPLALVGYHFSSKAGLFEALFERRMEDINADRRARLEAILVAAGDKPPPLDDVVDVLIGPLVRASHDPARGGVDFARLINDLLNTADQERVLPLIERYFDAMARPFIAALRRALPERSEADIQWAYHFASGALAHSIANVGRLARLSGGVCRAGDGEEHLARLRRYLIAGFSSPTDAAAEYEKLAAGD
jgi:AcrR family transcriptional regulator